MRLVRPETVAVRRPARRLRVWWWRLSLAYLVSLALLYLAEVRVAERSWVTLLLTYGPQYPFALPAPCLLLVSLLLRHGRALLANLLALALLTFGLLGVAVPHPRGAAPPGTRVRVMTLNAAYFNWLTPQNLADLVRRERLDVICLQECSPLEDSQRAGEVRKALPGWTLVREREEAILSRYPITSWRGRTFPSKLHRALAARFEVGGSDLTVVTTHLSTAYPPGRLRHQWRALAQYLQEATAKREAQAEELHAFLRELPGPVLLAGDFNTPPRGLIYHQLTANLRDSFVATGVGTGYTFSAKSPHYRIDYLFAGPGVTPRSCRTLPVRVSDHRPVVGEFVVRE